MNVRPHVALLIETSRAYGRGLLEGIASYSRAHGPWAIYCPERSLADDVPRWLPGWRGHGIIARVETRSLAAAIQATGLPAVDLRGKLDLPFPLIETNDRLVAHLAAEHLLERGFRHFAYCGFAGVNYSARRLKYFPTWLAERGFRCHIYPPPDAPAPSLDDDRVVTQLEQEAHGLLYEDQLAAWVASLPRPIGIMACNDIRGQQVLNACRAIGVQVPDEVAVVGVDNDQLLCELSDPPLSSVMPDTRRIGYEAAALLNRMMQGDPPPQGKIFIEPAGIIARQSTDVTAIDDPHVAQAVRFIRQHACHGITVEDVLDHVGISRAALDRRFTALLHRTPKAEILRVRLARIEDLLVHTDLTLPAIAELAGFKHVEYMCTVFKQKTGRTPGQHRRERRV